MAKQKQFPASLALLLASIAWGFNPPLIKLGLQTIPPSLFLSAKFLIIALFFLPFAIKTWKPITKNDLYLLIVSSVLFISVSSYTLNLGLARTTSINVAVLGLLSPLLLFILSVKFLKERLSIKTLAGIFIALCGSLVIIGKPWQAAGNSTELIGNLFVIISILSGVVATLLFKPLSKKMSLYQTTCTSFFFGVLPIAAYSATQFHAWNVAQISKASINGFVWSTFVILVANFLFFYALREKKVQTMGVYEYVQPVVTIIAAYFILAEKPSSQFLLGTIFIFAGLYLAEFSKAAKFRLPAFMRR